MKEETEKSELSGHLPRGRSPRKRSGLILVLSVLAGILLVVYSVLLFTDPDDPVPPPQADPGSEASVSDPARPSSGNSPAAALSMEGTEPLPTSPDEAQPDPARKTPTTPPPGITSSTIPSLPEIVLSPDTISEELESVSLPALPYSIFNGAYKSLQEAETTQRELLSHLIPSYIVPVGIEGSVAQSLYGVSTDGIWYRILIGHFPTRKDARAFLGTLMELRPNDQPEIMKFSYTLECGRFLTQDSPEPLMDRLRLDGFLPYTQTYPAREGDSSLTRILLGCNFSKQGAQRERDALAERGYSCKIEER